MLLAHIFYFSLTFARENVIDMIKYISISFEIQYALILIIYFISLILMKQDLREPVEMRIEFNQKMSTAKSESTNLRY